MINNEVKVLERLLLVRLNRAMAAAGDLADNQYGFHVDKGALQAIQEVLEATDVAVKGATRNRYLYLLIVLDVHNAFNMTPWVAIDKTTRKKKLPGYLVKILRSYMDSKKVIVPDDKGYEFRAVNCEVPQGSAWDWPCVIYSTTSSQKTISDRSQTDWL